MFVVILKFLTLNLLRILKRILKYYQLLFNFLSITTNDVAYKDFPRIVGQIVISNKGKLILGSQVSFRCAVSSNFVGLFKPVTICVTPGATLEIDDNSGFSGVSIYCSEKITIGKYVNCGGNVCIWDTDFHPLDYKDRRVHDLAKIKSSPIVIEDDVFIGANSIVLKGVTIGARSIIGAGSIVRKDIPCDEIWAGNPAKLVRRINNEE